VQLAKVAERFPLATVHHAGWLFDTFTENL